MKSFIAMFLAALGPLTLGASAQQVLYQETFENGLGAWTATGLWNLESSQEACGSTFGPFPSGTNVAWYGIQGSCNFQDGNANFGYLLQNDWVDLPPSAASISLRYWSSSESEYCWGDWDVHSVVIAAQNGPDSGFTAPYCTTWGPLYADLDWHERRVDLSAYRGARVRVGFNFQANDSAVNEGRGWLIDDVRIVIEPGVRFCPPEGLSSGCPCQPAFVPVAGGCRNSTAQSATLYSEGSPSLSADSLSFRAVLIPSATTALLVQGDAGIAPVVFGDGLRCVGGNRVRMGAVTASNGSASWPPPGTDPISVRGHVPGVGASRYYYVHYRDLGTYCTPSLFNVTDAQRIDWAP